MRLKLRTAERIGGELQVKIYELHPSYTQRIIQGLIDRAIELARVGTPESFKILLANRQRLELSPDQFARLETLCTMDEDLSAPPPRELGGGEYEDSEGPETL